jgi:hypothetical protein
MAKILANKSQSACQAGSPRCALSSAVWDIFVWVLGRLERLPELVAEGGLTAAGVDAELGVKCESELLDELCREPLGSAAAQPLEDLLHRQPVPATMTDGVEDAPNSMSNCTVDTVTLPPRWHAAAWGRTLCRPRNPGLPLWARALDLTTRVPFAPRSTRLHFAAWVA